MTTVIQFNELEVAITNNFQFEWKDSGSGSKYDFACYNVTAPPGFYATGSFGQGSYANPSREGYAITLKDPSGSPRVGGRLCHPVRYERVWQDFKGSGIYQDASFWRPIPPNGDYVALGLIAKARWNTPPNVNEVVCVKRDLTIPGEIGERLWGFVEHPFVINPFPGLFNMDPQPAFHAWKIKQPQLFNRDNEMGFSPNTFCGYAVQYSDTQVFTKLLNTYNQDKGRTGDGDDLNVFMAETHCLKLQVVPEELRQGEIAPPSTASGMTAGQIANWTPIRRIKVPFFMISFYRHTPQWNVNNSPYYYITREDSWKLLDRQSNTTSRESTMEYSKTTGISKEQSNTWNKEFSVSVTAEAGISFGAAEASTSITVSYTLGYSGTSTVNVSEQTTSTNTIPVPSHKEVRAWQQMSRLRVSDMNGDIVGELSNIPLPGIQFTEQDI